MKALLTALLKAQGDFDAVVKDKTNPAFKSTYATLGAVNEAVDEALRKHGLVILQDARMEFDGAGHCLVIVGTSLWHAESAESVSHSLALVAPQTTPQGIGSAISYGRRYGKMTLLGLAAEDDDGNSASGTKVPQSKAQGNGAPPPDEQNFYPDEQPAKKNGNGKAAPQPISADTLKHLHALGRDLYGDLWDGKRPALVQWASMKRVTSSKDLTEQEAGLLIDKLNERLAELKRAAAAEEAAGVPTVHA